MIIIDVEWKDDTQVEVITFGGDMSFEDLVKRASECFKGRQGSGEVVRFVDGDTEITL